MNRGLRQSAGRNALYRRDLLHGRGFDLLSGQVTQCVQVCEEEESRGASWLVPERTPCTALSHRTDKQACRTRKPTQAHTRALTQHDEIPEVELGAVLEQHAERLDFPVLKRNQVRGTLLGVHPAPAKAMVGGPGTVPTADPRTRGGQRARATCRAERTGVEATDLWRMSAPAETSVSKMDTSSCGVG